MPHEKESLPPKLCALLLAVSFSAAEQIKVAIRLWACGMERTLSQTQAEALRTVAGER